MPTPSESLEEPLPQLRPYGPSSCPPDSLDRPAQWSQQVLGDIEHAIADVATSSDLLRWSDQDDEVARLPDTAQAGRDGSQGMTPQEESSSVIEMSTPTIGSPEAAVDHQQRTPPTLAFGTSASALNLSYSERHGVLNSRYMQTHTSCKLRAGSQYRGTQTSDQQRYNVEVIIKSVDMSESFICGYLRIEGLTPEHATLTTYFEGEIIGSKYTFQTRHESWGASEKDDMKHWGHFTAWKPLAKQAKRADFHYKHSQNRENVFMRWKEKFLVPDHRVKEISGASFEGFYYICFNQIAGAISGIYYHSKSDQNHNNKIQNLELQWLPDQGRFAAMDFR